MSSGDESEGIEKPLCNLRSSDGSLFQNPSNPSVSY